tara:strand:- start:28344 stop:29339 length:996 start_codon:yes stop_codon:yes gene_type:complete
MKTVMSRFNLIFLIAFVILITGSSCSSDDDEDLGNWINRSIFDGSPRSGTSYFTIGDTGYMGTGYDGDDYLNSFWAYDLNGDFWTQKADFPGAPRNAGVGFVVADKGYIGSGYDGVDELDDFYVYDPSSNSWNPIATFPKGPRRNAIAFGTDGTGYFGTGYDGENDLKDFWKYDPANDSWDEMVGFGGNKRRSATSFQIGEKVYMGTGVSNGVYQDDFWEFDPASETWTKLLDLDEEDDYTITRSNAVAFTLNGYGYIATGERSGATTSVWEYDPGSDTWESKTAFEGATRQDAVAFHNGSRAFVGMGRTGTLYLDDLDEFFPFQEYDDED